MDTRPISFQLRWTDGPVMIELESTCSIHSRTKSPEMNKTGLVHHEPLDAEKDVDCCPIRSKRFDHLYSNVCACFGLASELLVN